MGRARLADHAPLIRELSGDGYSDPEIARELGLRRDTVRVWRNRLGLPPVPIAAWGRMAERYRRQIARAGVVSLVEMRWRRQA